MPDLQQRRMVAFAHEAGIPVATREVYPSAFVGVDLHRELAGYVAAGLTPYQALRAATATPAEALGLNAGTVEPGKLADLLFVQGDPLEDISAAYRVKRVIANGRVLDLAALLSTGR